MVAARAAEIYETEADRRRRAAQNNNAGKAVKENLPELEKGQSRDQAGKALGVSGKSVDFDKGNARTFGAGHCTEGQYQFNF